MSLIITGKNLKIEDIVDVARNYKHVSLSMDSMNKIKICRKNSELL